MNWSGGYKNRFRPNTEIRKTAFQQQSRIILVEKCYLVKNDGLEQPSHISKSIEKEFSNISPKKETVSIDNNIPIQRQHFGTPFHNIPCGSSSDTEGSENDELSDTNYSPYSIDQESAAEHHITKMSEENQVNVLSSHNMVDAEYYEDLNSREVLFPQQSSQSSTFVNNSAIECLTPPPYLDRNPYYSSPNLSFLTPVIHRKNNTFGYSAIEGRFGKPGFDQNSNLHNFPHSTSLTDKTVFTENSMFKTPVQTDSRKASSTTNCSQFVPVNVTPAQRKQVHFCSSYQESTAKDKDKNFSVRNQVNVSSPVREQYENSGVNTPPNRRILRTSSVEPRSTPTPYYVNQHFNYPTPNLSSSTTGMRHENLIAFPTIDQRIPRLEGSTVHNLPYSTPINTNKKKPEVFPTTPIKPKAVNHNIPDQANCSLLPALDVTPAQRKQVQFAPSATLRKTKINVNIIEVSNKEISNLKTSTFGTSATSFANGSSMDLMECQTSPSNKEEQSVVITEGTVSTHHDSCREETDCFVQSSNEMVTMDPLPSLVISGEKTSNTHDNYNKQADPKSTNQKRKLCATSWKTSFRKKLHGRSMQHCCGRAVIQKIKIRDAETQTSP